MRFDKNNTTSLIPLKFLQWNCRGIKKKHASLVNLTNTHDIAVILLSETHLDPSMQFQLKGFKIMRKDNQSNSRGVLIAVNEHMNPVPCHLNGPAGIDVVGCSINSSSGVITIISIYIHPNSTINARELELFLNSIPKPFIVGGDWNAKHSLWGNAENDRRGNVVYDVLESLGLVVLNNGNHTRFDRSRASSAIDITVSSADISLCFTWDTLNNPFSSDHVPIVFEMEFSSCNTGNARAYHRIDWESYSVEVLRRIDSLRCESFDDFCNIIRESIASITSVKNVNPGRKIPQPWWDSELQTKVVQVHDTFQRWKRSGYSRILYECYQACDKEFKQMVKIKKREAWKKNL